MAQLICGCCGRYYPVKPGIKSEYDQDTGYGTCPECKYIEDDSNEAEWIKMENLFANSLSLDNATKFRALELEVRRGLLLEALDDKIITYEINRR